MVFLAVERFLSDLERAQKKDPSFPYYFDQGAAVAVIKYFRDLCPFRLVPFQQFIAANIFGWKVAGVHCDIHPEGHRRFQTAYIEEGKGNGKTPLAAGIGTYLVCADGEPSAEVYIAAPSKEQAAICFRDAVRIVDESRELKRLFKQHGCSGKMLSGNLSYGTSFIRPISAEHKTLDGPRPHGVIPDELHEHASTMVLDKLTAGFKARHQPLSFEPTNSGWDRETICFYHHDYSRQVLEGIFQNEAWFPYVCQLDACEECRKEGNEQPVEGCNDCDSWLDESTWIKANPGLGTILQKSYLDKQVKEALEMPATASLKKRLNFCIWTQNESRAIARDQWKKCAGAGAADPAEWRRRQENSELRGKRCFSAMDLASTTDIAAVAHFFPKQAGVPKPVLLVDFFIPEQALMIHVTKNRVPMDHWSGQGFVFKTPGAVIDYTFIRKRIKEFSETHPIEEFAFDPWNATEIVTNLENDGFKMVKHPQTIEKYAAPTKDFLKMIAGAEFEHGNNPVLSWMADNLVVRSDASGNQRPVKPDNPSSPKKIDGMTAAIMADGRMTANPESGSRSPFFI